MRRQRLRARQAHSVCALCASRLARNAPRLPSHGASLLQTRENSSQPFHPAGTANFESQSPSDGSHDPASSHASQTNPQTSSAPSGAPRAPQSSAKNESDDLDFMDAVGVGRGPVMASQQAQSEQPQSSANSMPSLGATQSYVRPEIAGQGGQGNQKSSASSAAKESPTHRLPNFRVRYNMAAPSPLITHTKMEESPTSRYETANGPPKGPRFDSHRTSSWSHLKTNGQSRDQDGQHGGHRRENTSKRPQERTAKSTRFLNPLRMEQVDKQSSAYESKGFASILERLGSNSSQWKSSGQSTEAPKSAAPIFTSRYRDISDISFADYSSKDLENQTKRQNDASRSTKASSAEEQSDEFDFMQSPSSPRPASASEQAPATIDEKSTVPESYQDPSDDFDFTAIVPASRPALAPRETSAPEAQPAPRPSSATQQETSPGAKSASGDHSAGSSGFDFMEPRSNSRSEPMQHTQADAVGGGRMTLMSADEFLKDDGSTSRQKETRSTQNSSWAEETWAESAARRAKEQPQISPEPTLAPMQKRVQWSMPPEEPRRKPKLSRFVQDEEEVDDGQRKRKVNRSSKLNLAESDLEGGIKAEAKAERKAKRRQELEAKRSDVEKPTPLYLPEYITVSNFANLLKVRADSLLKKMEEFGYEDVHQDDILNAENAGLIAAEYNYDPIPPLPEDMDIYPTPEPEDRSALPLRPPVVTIMGHVDHGKTTLLDFLRKSSVAASEFGGITQHIGAFNVALSSGKTITFLDTPGHAAFLNMRQRGANVTDIVILVVAADDGVKAQTEEAIKHAQSAGVPIIVAINKIDREGADVQRVKQDLARHDLYVEDFGGDIQAVPVSGKTGQGMGDLEEATSLLSEILDHRADPNGPVEGHIIEASTKERGRVATLLIRRGTLKVGDIIVAGTTFARVRTMRNEAGVEVDSVGPGMPAEIDGWRGQPEAGDEFLEAPNEQRANEAIEYRTVTRERVKMAKDMEVIAEARRQEHERREKEARRQEEIAKATKAGIKNPVQYVDEMEKTLDGDSGSKQKREEVPLVLKADVSGSEEACHDYIMTVGNNEVCPKIARSGVGPVSEFDVEFASAANGYIVAFNVEIPQHIRRLAGYHGVKLIENNVIYRLVDDIKKILEERLPPLVTHKVTGDIKILQEFEINVGNRKKMRIAGCRVENGMVKRTSKVKVLRGDKVIYQGTLSSLKNVKRDVSEMRKDTECGIGFEGWSAFKVGDAIQCYEEVFQKRYL